jgi:adenine-specific DNA-methyltransferase
VIGNPPYIFGRDWKSLGIKNDIKLYFGKKYKTCSYQLDMFSIFMEKASDLCSNNGFIGQIVPNVWLTNKYSNKTRSYILSQANKLTLLIPPAYCFQKQTVDTIVYIYQKNSKPGNDFKIKSMKDGNIIDFAKHNLIDYIDGIRPISTTIDNISILLISNIYNNYPQLKCFADITRGVHPYRVGGYGVTAFGTGYQIERDVKERPYNSEIKKENFREFIYGRDLKRFTQPTAKEYIKYGPWLAEPRDPKFFENERIYSRKILSNRLVVTIEKKNSIADQQVYITLPKNILKVCYLAGLLGSRLIAFFIRRFFNEEQDLFPQIKVTQLKSIPIKPIDFADPADLARHDRMVALVQRMLELNKQAAEAALPFDRERWRRQIEATDREIDALVYELYGLSEEEIKLLEESQA